MKIENERNAFIGGLNFVGKKIIALEGGSFKYTLFNNVDWVAI